MATYSLIDLFAGCGAMSRGFADTGRFEPIFAVESDKSAAATYLANFREADVRDERIELVEDFPAADIVIGGPPCQGFSPLNRVGKEVESRRLWREYLRGLLESRPAAFVMENVPQMLDSPEYVDFVRSIESAGDYELQERVLNVADYGVPQRRLRAIVVGTRSGGFRWPRRTHADPELRDSTRAEWTTFAEAVEGLPLVPDEQNWHRKRNPWPESVRRYQAVPPGGDRFDMERSLDSAGLGHLVPPCWRKHRTGSYDVFGRLWWDRPATTIRTEFFKPEKGRYLHPSEHRAITVREAARLMSFDDDFVLPEDQPMTTIARQIGNAVPPVLARCIAESVALALDEDVAADVTRLQAA